MKKNQIASDGGIKGRIYVAFSRTPVVKERKQERHFLAHNNTQKITCLILVWADYLYGKIMLFVELKVQQKSRGGERGREETGSRCEVESYEMDDIKFFLCCKNSTHVV